MKRVLTLALLISCISFAQAQTLTVSYNDAAVADGDTLTLTASSNDEIQFRPSFHNSWSSNLICRVQGERLNTTTVELWSICTGLLCVSGMQSAPFAIAAGSTYDDIHIDFMVPSDASMGLFKISVYDTLNTNTRAYFYVKVFPHVGIAETEQSVSLNAYPNPAAGQVRVDYSANDGNGKLVVYNLAGVCVREMALGEGQGSVNIDLAGLPSGVYMYGIKNGQYSSAMKKLVVK